MRSITTLCLCLLFIGCGPIVTVPGGKLSGATQPMPSSWAFTDEIEIVQLETRPSDPYSVNIWTVATEDGLYIVAGSGPETAWARNIEADPRVRLRVDDSIYELKAVRSNDDASRDVFLVEARKKYDFDPEQEDLSKAVVYRLESR